MNIEVEALKRHLAAQKAAEAPKADDLQSTPRAKQWTPPGTEFEPMKRRDFDALSHSNRAAFIRDGGKVID